MDFEEKLYGAINRFLDQGTRSSSEPSYNTRLNTERYFAVKAQHVLRRLLQPWVKIDIFQGPEGPAVAILRHFESQKIFEPCKTLRVAEMVNVMTWARWDRICIMFRAMERSRILILREGKLDHDDEELAVCFRKYLERGDDCGSLPLVNSGTRQERQHTPVSFRTSFMTNLPPSNTWRREKALLDSRAKLRQSDVPDAVKERRAITQYFANRRLPDSLQLAARPWQQKGN